MRPYLLAAYNVLRFSLRSLRSGGRFRAGRVQLLGWNTKLVVQPGARVAFGNRLVSDGRVVLVAGAEGDLSIGDGVYFNEGVMLSCQELLSVGSGCRFGPNVKVFDNDHKFDADSGVSSELVTAPVRIGKNCWLGSNVVILRGTTIGDNCVIGAGCVVKGEIPAGSLVTMSRELKIRPIRREA